MAPTGPDSGATRPVVDRVRVGKFDWERLMMVSPLPWPTRSILLTLAIYMDDDGGSARPGLPALVRLTRGRTVVIEHLQSAVDAGYLEVVERGGFRRATARATEYAATVPVEVYQGRALILSSPPWRRGDASPTSGLPDLGEDERPAGRTLADPRTSGEPDVDASRRSGFDGRRSGFGSRTSGEPDPINHLTSTTQHQPELHEARPKASRGTRIPNDFAVTAEMRTWYREHTPDVDIAIETANFVDHWRAASGAKATKADWTAAWRTWMRNAQKWKTERASNGRSNGHTTTGANRHVDQLTPEQRAARNPFSTATRASQHTNGAAR